MSKLIKLLALAVSLSLVACDDAEKKVAEAKALADKTAADAKAAADKAAAEAKAAADKAAAAAMEALNGQKADLGKKLDEGIAALDTQVTALKEKAKKLPAKVKGKADAAFAAYETAKANVLALKTQLEALKEPAGLAELTGKITTALADAQKAVEGAAAAVGPAPKKK